MAHANQPDFGRILELTNVQVSQAHSTLFLLSFVIEAMAEEYLDDDDDDAFVCCCGASKWIQAFGSLIFVADEVTFVALTAADDEEDEDAAASVCFLKKLIMVPLTGTFGVFAFADPGFVSAKKL